MSLNFNPSDQPDSYGHHFIVGLSGVTLDDYDKAILGKLRPVGVLLLKRNFDHTRPYQGWLELLARLIEDVKRYTGHQKIIVSLDHEGGRVHRVPPPITVFPAAMKYAKKSAEVAKAMATDLKSLGVNVSWSPLADIHSNPNNPIIGDRAFGTTAAEVSTRAAEFLVSLQSNGVLGCAKHYPGHGDTSTDSHLELPLLNLSEAQLRERELIPFKALIDAGAPFVMTAHILYPQIDQYCPATLSKQMLNDILRNEMGFSGIILSDDLDMKAVSEGFNQEESVGIAVNAGCDMFIVARHPDPSSDRPLVLTNYLYRCLRKKFVSEERLHQSFSRIEDLFTNRLQSYAAAKLDPELLEQHAELCRSLG